MSDMDWELQGGPSSKLDPRYYKSLKNLAIHGLPAFMRAEHNVERNGTAIFIIGYGNFEECLADFVLFLNATTGKFKGIEGTYTHEQLLTIQEICGVDEEAA